MPDLSGMSPITIKLTDTLLHLANRLRAGQTIQTTISGSAKEPFVQIGNQRLPIPSGANARAGDSVIVQVQQQPDGPRIVITPAPAHGAASAPPSTNLDFIARIVQQLATEFPELRALSPQQQASLVPSRLPALETVVRLALETLQLHQTATLAQAREVVLTALTAAASGGASKALTTQVAALLGAGIDISDARALEQLVRTMGEQALRSPMATLQSMGSAGGAAQVDSDTAGLYHLLSLMRNDAQVLAALGGAREVQQFQGATDTLRDHLAGQSLQNSRSLDMPYLFMNLPLGEAFERAQLHIFGEGDGRDGSEHEAGTLVLDLELSKLGSLWLEVRHRGDQCACQFFVANESVADAIRSASDQLVERLESSAFKQVSVQATADDRERVAALASLLQPMSGLDLRA